MISMRHDTGQSRLHTVFPTLSPYRRRLYHRHFRTDACGGDRYLYRKEYSERLSDQTQDGGDRNEGSEIICRRNYYFRCTYFGFLFRKGADISPRRRLRNPHQSLFRREAGKGNMFHQMKRFTRYFLLLSRTGGRSPGASPGLCRRWRRR